MNDDTFGAFMIGLFLGVVLLLSVLSMYDNFVTVETDKLTNTKFIEYKDTIYTLTPYKKITKE